MSVSDKKSLNVELSWNGKGKTRLEIPWLDPINKIPVLAKEFPISSQLVLFHQDLLGCGVFFLNKHGWSARLACLY